MRCSAGTVVSDVAAGDMENAAEINGVEVSFGRSFYDACASDLTIDYGDRPEGKMEARRFSFFTEEEVTKNTHALKTINAGARAALVYSKLGDDAGASRARAARQL